MMPMENTLQLGNLLKEGTYPEEYTGGEKWTILHGDTLKLVKAFQPGIFDAVITDPPYASGGTKQNERNRTTNQKYSSMKAENALPDFDGDNKDQRSWTHWMTEWLYDVRKACKVGAPICLFIDWRQYPSITDALQWAGWIWRGTAVWDKGDSLR
jgi:site-specific DNA-methyltransferase (adenine-specific)